MATGKPSPAKLPTHAVGIDLGTTYSCISYLNEHGEPVTVPNRDGELCTPSAVLIDRGEIVVGTEALRNSVRKPDRVIQHAKRFMGNPDKKWIIDGRGYTPLDVSTLILRSLLDSARERLGSVDQAVITVPAQFSEVQRQATAEAGKRAGLKKIDIINEPVAAALCFVLGTEGIWFTELATSQMIMVADLGGGTFDLSLVRYQKNEVVVVASGGDLQLGGADWNAALQKAIAKQFARDFNLDVMKDRESAQALALEVEQAKRSLSIRPRTVVTCQTAGQRKSYQVDQAQFERQTSNHVARMEKLVNDLLTERKLGWAHVDVVLTTGGASRMPMVREMLKRLSGRTLNTSLSPDQSIAHGATYYAGMLISNSQFARSILKPQAAARLAQFKQKSVNARALGILVREMETGERVPHYFLPANTSLPTSVTTTVGTVKANQRRVQLRVVESGTSSDDRFVEIGTCQVEPLPAGLPEGEEITVTIRYDEQARVLVEAKVLRTGQVAQTEFIRLDNVITSALTEDAPDAEIRVKSGPREAAPKAIVPLATEESLTSDSMEELSAPVLLCNTCEEPLDAKGNCPKCAAASARGGARRPAPALPPIPLPSDDEIIDLVPKNQPKPRPKSATSAPLPAKPKVKAPPLPPSIKPPR